MCLYSRLVNNPKYQSNKKNGGNIPTISDKRVAVVPIGCGNCIECRKKKAREWQVRLLEDIRHNKNGKFIALTFSNESITKLTEEVRKKESKKIKHELSREDLLEEAYELDNKIATLAVRYFTERWRKKYKKTIRHWLITELGHNGTEHIHMHGIVWTDESMEEVEKIWQYGHVWKGKEVEGQLINYVNENTIAYTVKYVMKIDSDHEYYKPKVLTSRGMGAGYMNRVDSQRNKYKEKDTNETYTTRTGHKVGLPIYWKNKIYTEEEREKLWIEKLNKQQRWVMGEKVDISEDEKEYYRLLKYYQKMNKRLGYGDGKINWTKKNYENERRRLKILERIKDDIKIIERKLIEPTTEKEDIMYKIGREINLD